MAGKAGPGMARFGMFQHGRRVLDRRGGVWSVQVWQGKAGEAERGKEWKGPVWSSRQLKQEIQMKAEKELLTRMARRNGGVLMVDDVLNEAQSEDSILHKHFEWDDSEAADLYRKQQARALIQRCKIQMVESDPVEIRAFVSLPTDRSNGGGYRLTSEVVGNEYMKEELLHDIRLTISRWNKKLHLLDQNLSELLVEVERRVTITEERRAA